ncbi:hypothetical protein [Sodalis sp.]|uniref:hypothetical protein n=1 Tax=Sodalis sp. (in: enterobacteria) TaxID=1898979 RepID=UPI003872E8A7
MNGLLTGLLARRETGLIEEIEKLERRIAHMENQSNEGMWISGDDMQLSQYTANRKRILLNENSEALSAVRILRCQGFSREQIEKEWKRQESQDKKSELVIEFIHILQNKGVNFSIGGENIAVHGTLDLSGTNITSLPDNLSVDDSLDLEKTCITRLPNNLKVGGFIYLHPEKITNIAYRKFLRNGDYTVFAAWINGECCIVVNSMIYTLREFFRGLPTTDVEQAARECVAELTQRWKAGGAA